MIDNDEAYYLRVYREGDYLFKGADRVVVGLARCDGIALRPAPSGCTQPRGNSVDSIWSKITLNCRAFIPGRQNVPRATRAVSDQIEPR